jgi:hypothetical protein
MAILDDGDAFHLLYRRAYQVLHTHTQATTDELCRIGGVRWLTRSSTQLPLRSSTTDLFFLPCHKTTKQTNATESALLVATLTSGSPKVNTTQVNPEEESMLETATCPAAYKYKSADPLPPFQLARCEEEEATAIKCSRAHGNGNRRLTRSIAKIANQ